MRVPVDQAGLEAILTPLQQGKGSVSLAPGVTLAVTLDPASAERRIATVTLDPVGPGEVSTLLRVPLSATYVELFAEASLQGTLAVADQETPTPFEATYEVDSPNGGLLGFKVTPGSVEVHLRSPSTSLTAGSVGEPATEGEAHEVVSAQVRVAVDFLTFRRLVRSVFDPLVGGVGDLCEEGGAFTANAPHDWYAICIKVSDPKMPVSVDVDLRTRDGRRLPIARSPGSIRTATLWVAAIDHLAATALVGGDGAVEMPSASFDYRDPDVRGGAVFTASAVNGQVVFDHRSITPPSTLPDLEPLARPETPPEPPAADDPCAAVGSVKADAGRLVVDAQLDASLVTLGGFAIPLSGNVHASIYRSEDVALLGPNEDAVAVATFTIADVALGSEVPVGRFVSDELPAGTYMVLGFFDVGGDSDPENPRPLGGEPISLPLRRVELQCAAQPATVLFDATYPK